ncbi:MAG: hypothetical protein JXQ87_13710 [Bacteroidia bacterium]
MKAAFIIAFSLLFSNQIFSQNNCTCCTETHGQFEFWVGNWNVYDTLDNKVGENNVVHMQDRCLIQENWKSKNSTGTSYNYFDKNDSSWHQLWVDNAGNVLKLKGEFDGTSMILKGDIQKTIDGLVFYHQISWTPKIDGSVTQIWTMNDKNGRTLQTLFYGVYKEE